MHDEVKEKFVSKMDEIYNTMQETFDKAQEMVNSFKIENFIEFYNIHRALMFYYNCNNQLLMSESNIDRYNEKVNEINETRKIILRMGIINEVTIPKIEFKTQEEIKTNSAAEISKVIDKLSETEDKIAESILPLLQELLTYKSLDEFNMLKYIDKDNVQTENLKIKGANKND